MCLFVFLAEEEFDELCFDYGLELDEVVSLEHVTKINESLVLTVDLFSVM